MSGPVWRIENDRRGVCEICLREVTGLYVEGEVRDSDLSARRLVCPRCYTRRPSLVIAGERPDRRSVPAYARRG